MEEDGSRNAHNSEGCNETSGRQIGDAVRNQTEFRGYPAATERSVDAHPLTAVHDEDPRGSSPLVDIGAQTVSMKSPLTAFISFVGWSSKYRTIGSRHMAASSLEGRMNLGLHPVTSKRHVFTLLFSISTYHPVISFYCGCRRFRKT